MPASDPSVSSDERFRVQLAMMQNGAEELQRHFSRLDEILFRTKASGVTVWIALNGWAFTADSYLIRLAGPAAGAS